AGRVWDSSVTASSKSLCPRGEGGAYEKDTIEITRVSLAAVKVSRLLRRKSGVSSQGPQPVEISGCLADRSQHRPHRCPRKHARPRYRDQATAHHRFLQRPH